MASEHVLIDVTSIGHSRSDLIEQIPGHRCGHCLQSLVIERIDLEEKRRCLSLSLFFFFVIVVAAVVFDALFLFFSVPYLTRVLASTIIASFSIHVAICDMAEWAHAAVFNESANNG